MADAADELTDRVAAAVLQHLARHPNARDTGRGIRDCWLPASLQGMSQEDVERALQRLVDEGRIDAVSVLNNQTLYARAQHAPAPPSNRGALPD